MKRQATTPSSSSSIPPPPPSSQRSNKSSLSTVSKKGPVMEDPRTSSEDEDHEEDHDLDPIGGSTTTTDPADMTMRPFLTTRPKPVKWTEEDDRLLRAAVAKHGDKKWKEISWEVPNRNHVQCLQRWNKVLKPGLKKGCWNDEEDAKLIGLVNEAGENVINWGLLAMQIEGRTPKQCRERWQCYLDPLIDRGPFTANEDSVVLEMQSQFGNRWSLIAQSLPGRTENAIKTRFRSIQRIHRTRWSHQEDQIVERVELGGLTLQEALAQLPNRDIPQIQDRIKVLSNSRNAAELRATRAAPAAAVAQMPSSSSPSPSPTTGLLLQQQRLSMGMTGQQQQADFTQSQFLPPPSRNKNNGNMMMSASTPTSMAPSYYGLSPPSNQQQLVDPQGMMMSNFSGGGGGAYYGGGMPAMMDMGQQQQQQQGKMQIGGRRNTEEFMMANFNGGLDAVDIPPIHHMGNRRDSSSANNNESPRMVKRMKTASA